MPDGKQRRGEVSAAVLLIDVINHFEYPDGERILSRTDTNRTPSSLASGNRAHKVGISTIYVNDNFGDWSSDAAKLFAYYLRREAVGREFVEKIKPNAKDYFVLEPMHVAFYQIPA
jgi:nicotinamidase-related amidase